MSYYGAGDYYGAGGILSSIGGALKKVGGAVVRAVLPSVPVVGTIAAGILSSSARPATLSFPTQLPRINLPGSGAPGAGIGPIGTPAHMATYLDRRFYTKDGRPRRIRRDGRPWKRPTMDPGNTRALARASRRTDRFVGIARTALKNTKWTVASRTAGRRKKK